MMISVDAKYFDNVSQKTGTIMKLSEFDEEHLSIRKTAVILCSHECLHSG